MFIMVVHRARLPRLGLRFPLQALPRDPRSLLVHPDLATKQLVWLPQGTALCPLYSHNFMASPSAKQPQLPSMQRGARLSAETPPGNILGTSQAGWYWAWLASWSRTPCHTYPPGTAEMSPVLLSTAQQCRLFRTGKSQFRYKYQSK